MWLTLLRNSCLQSTNKKKQKTSRIVRKSINFPAVHCTEGTLGDSAVGIDVKLLEHFLEKTKATVAQVFTVIGLCSPFGLGLYLKHTLASPVVTPFLESAARSSSTVTRPESSASSCAHAAQTSVQVKCWVAACLSCSSGLMCTRELSNSPPRISWPVPRRSPGSPCQNGVLASRNKRNLVFWDKI